MTAWELLAVALVCAVMWRFFTRPVVGDLEMMAFGCIVYIASPMIIYDHNWLEDGPGVAGWRNMFADAFNVNGVLIVFTLALGAGYAIGRAWSSRGPRALDRPFGKSMLLLLSIALWVFWLAEIALNYGALGGGYNVEVGLSLLGQLGTANLMLMVFILNCRQHKLNHGKVYLSLLLLLILNCLALLSLGGRLYVLAAALSLGLQSLSKVEGFKQRLKLLTIAMAVIGGLVFVGVWRIGGETEASFFAFIAAAEGLFTSMSLGSFIQNNGMPAFAFPSNFVGSVINFVPSFFIADKSLIIPTIQEAGWYFESPLGATNLFVALLGNFGWLGSLVFMTIFGWFIGSVRRVNKRGWWLYFYLCALLPFMFFRDGFSIFNKAAFFNGMILPFCIMALDRMFWPRRRGRSIRLVST